jgi:hypothetical protein
MPDRTDALRFLWARALEAGDRAAALIVAARICAICPGRNCDASRRRSCAREYRSLLSGVTQA